MVSSAATTVEAYLDSLPAERRAIVRAVRERVAAHMPPGFAEVMNWGMICWVVPLARYPDTYNRQPLAYVSLAAQKAHIALYLMCAYSESEDERALRDAFAAAGKRLDMGKSCLRFRTMDDVPWEAVEALIGRYSVDEWIETTERVRRASTVARKPAAGKAPAKASPGKAPRAKATPGKATPTKATPAKAPRRAK